MTVLMDSAKSKSKEKEIKDAGVEVVINSKSKEAKSDAVDKSKSK